LQEYIFPHNLQVLVVDYPLDFLDYPEICYESIAEGSTYFSLE